MKQEDIVLVQIQEIAYLLGETVTFYFLHNNLYDVGPSLSETETKTGCHKAWRRSHLRYSPHLGGIRQPGLNILGPCTKAHG